MGIAPQKRAFSWKRFARRLPGLIAFGYVLWLAILFFAQDKLVFPREYAPAAPENAIPPQGAFVLKREIPEGTVEAWYMPAPGVKGKRGLAIFWHGNAETIDMPNPLIEQFHKLGFDVLTPEFRGYGRGAGKPSQKAITEDALWFYDQAMARPEVDRNRVILSGWSLGAAVAAQVADRRPTAGLILISPFTSMVSMGHQYGAPGIICRHPFRTDRVVRRLDAPTLILHGSNDEMIPVSHGRRLAGLARHGTCVELPCGHLDILDQPGIAGPLAQFLHSTASAK